MRVAGVTDPEIHVVGEVMQRGHQSLTEIRQPLRGKIADQVVVPKYIRPLGGAAVVGGFCGNAVHRGRTHALVPRPLDPGSGWTAIRADAESRGEQSVTGPAAALLQVRKRPATTRTRRTDRNLKLYFG